MLVVPQSSVFMVVAIVFALIAHPKTFLLVHKFSKMIGAPNVVTQYGLSTTTGLLVHALVAALVAVIFLRLL